MAEKKRVEKLIKWEDLARLNTKKEMKQIFAEHQQEAAHSLGLLVSSTLCRWFVTDDGMLLRAEE